MRSLVPNDITVLLPEEGVDQEYWTEFQHRIVPRIDEICDSVHIIRSDKNNKTDTNIRHSGLYLGIAPAVHAPRPARPHRSCWIPRMGESNWRSHPWSLSRRILLPLGISGVPEGLPVSHLGCGVQITPTVKTETVCIISHGSELEKHPDIHTSSYIKLLKTTDSPHDLSGSILALIWLADPAEAMPYFLSALSHGVVPIVPNENRLLRYMCEYGSLGIPCTNGIEAIQVARYLISHERARKTLIDAGRRYIRRRLSWESVWRRLRASLLDMVAPEPRVTVVVLNWNGKNLLPDCFESLREQEYPGMTPMLVDNGSADGSVDFMRNIFPEVTRIRNERNLGFAEGNNIGMRRAVSNGSDYVALLNNDTRVGKRWIRELVLEAETGKDVGIVGSKMLFYGTPRIINSAGGVMNQCFYGWDHGVFQHDGREWNRSADRFSVTGGAMLIRSAALETGGYFDPVYFAYYEDNDLCHRLRLRGWRIRYTPRSVVFHKHSATSGSVSDWKTFLLERSRYRFILKHIPSEYFLSHLPAILRQELTEISAWARGRDYRRILLQIKAATSALLRLPHILMWRLFGSSGDKYHWTRQLEPGFCRPEFPRIGGEFDDLYDGLMPRGRAMPALMKSGLSGDWSDVVVSLPRYRILDSHGTVKMGNHAYDSAVLQIHVFLPPGTDCSELTVRLSDDNEQCFHIPHPGWHTLGALCDDVPSDMRLSLYSEHPVGINEISLIPSDHPVARVM